MFCFDLHDLKMAHCSRGYFRGSVLGGEMMQAAGAFLLNGVALAYTIAGFCFFNRKTKMVTRREIRSTLVLATLHRWMKFLGTSRGLNMTGQICISSPPALQQLNTWKYLHVPSSKQLKSSWKCPLGEKGRELHWVYLYVHIWRASFQPSSGGHPPKSFLMWPLWGEAGCQPRLGERRATKASHADALEAPRAHFDGKDICECSQLAWSTQGDNVSTLPLALLSAALSPAAPSSPRAASKPLMGTWCYF